MQAEDYCMLPDCQMEGHMSFRFSPHMDELLTDTPEEAKLVLQHENHNYFLISSNTDIRDPLPFVPLFAPDKNRAISGGPLDQRYVLLAYLAGSRHDADSAAMG